MNKREVSHVLRSMGALLEIKGEEGFKVRAYERAAEAVERGDFDLDAMAREGRLTEIPGIGKNLEPKVSELLLTGRSSFLERLVEEVPDSLLDLLRVPGIGAKTVRLLHDSLGVSDLAGLKQALLLHKVRDLPGMGVKREELMQKGLHEIERYSGRVSLGLALPVLEGLAEAFAAQGIVCETVGESRRYEETVASLEALVREVPGEPMERTLARAAILPSAAESDLLRAWDREEEAFVFQTSFGVPLRFHFAGEAGFWPEAARLTGPDWFVRLMEEKAKGLGLRMDSSGLMKSGSPVEIGSEQEFFSRLGAPVIPPEVRHRRELVEKAFSGDTGWLKDLVSPKDLRGDLHLHTTWSDGTAGIEEMAQKALSMGYSYMAITDHATDIGLIRGLTPERVEAQLREIEELRPKYPGIKILSGVEVDIVREGRLYLPDEVLARLDVVVASVHQDIGDSKGELISRVTKAAMNPNVDIIGHPTGRLIGRRPGHLSGFDPVFDAAAARGTAFEINSSPERLDLPEDLVSQAMAAGARFAVSTDAHSAAGMDGVRYGVYASARRAGVAKSLIVNASALPPEFHKE